MTAPATFAVQNCDGYRLIVATGEIDIGNAGDFKLALQDAAPAGMEALIVSLADVTYLDSNALAVLIEATRRFAVSRRQLCVVCPPESLCAKLVRIAGIHNVLPMFDALDAAIAGLTAK